MQPVRMGHPQTAIRTSVANEQKKVSTSLEKSAPFDKTRGNMPQVLLSFVSVACVAELNTALTYARLRLPTFTKFPVFSQIFSLLPAR